MRWQLASWFRNPTYVLAAVGLSGFAIDMLWKPISNAGLILLAVACAPWLTRLIKSAKVAGVEVDFMPTAPASETAARLAQEVNEPTAVPHHGQISVDSSSHEMTSTQPSISASATGDLSKSSGSTAEAVALPAEAQAGSGGVFFRPGQNLAQAYLLEGLVLQDLQKEIGGLLQREVRILNKQGRSTTVDGLIVRGDEAVAVEVKLFIRRPPISALIEQEISRLRSIPLQLKEQGYVRSRVIVAIVTGPDLEPEVARRIEEQFSLSVKVSVRFFQAQQLLEKYGFEPNR